MKTSTIATGALAVLALTGLAIAGSDLGNPDVRTAQATMHGQGDMGGPGSTGTRPGDEGPASMAFRGANEKMHRDMAITYSGEVDVDFVRGMIPHHQGAIDMAKIVIAFGNDPEIRKLAEGIVGAQEKEIAEMRAWLAARGK